MVYCRDSQNDQHFLDHNQIPLRFTPCVSAMRDEECGALILFRWVMGLFRVSQGFLRMLQ